LRSIATTHLQDGRYEYGVASKVGLGNTEFETLILILIPTVLFVCMRLCLGSFVIFTRYAKQNTTMSLIIKVLGLSQDDFGVGFVYLI